MILVYSPKYMNLLSLLPLFLFLSLPPCLFLSTLTPILFVVFFFALSYFGDK